MSRVAYRLESNKYEPDYYNLGFNKDQVNTIVNFIYDIDEDYTSKKEYIQAAKEYQKDLLEKEGLDVDWRVMFDDVTQKNYKSGYAYCSRCGCFFWDDDYCECD